MKHFTSIGDVDDPQQLIQQTIELKQNPTSSNIGRHKTVGLIFFNPSLRTRLSTQKAAQNLGMDVIVLNISKDSWKVEFEDGTVMDGISQEHIKDTVKVISSYCDILAVRSFATLRDRKKDYSEQVLNNFIKYSSVPVISMESATLHPLQSLTDMATIADSGVRKPKVVLSWTPHPKPLPQAVANSFLQWIPAIEADITITHPQGYELAEGFADGFKQTYDQEEAFEDADVIYAKNWSSYADYGAKPKVDDNWTITPEKMALTNQAQFMHCLPIRRNVVASDEVVDSSIVYQQAKNREFAAQAVLQNLLEDL